MIAPSKLIHIEEERRQRKAQLAEKRKQERVAILRKTKRKELLKLAQKAAKWIREFYYSQDGQEIFQTQEYVTVFTAPFLNGFPVKDGEMSVFASLEIDKNGEVYYGERYKYFTYSDVLLGQVGLAPKNFINLLHPKYLQLFVKALDSGEIQEHIKQFLRMT